jgi:CYTH domain-containing protein
MSTEIERRFKNFDYPTIGTLLGAHNFERIGGFLFKLTVFNPTKPGQTVRIRDDQNRITFTVKQKNPEDQYDTEWDVNISDYNTMF